MTENIVHIKKTVTAGAVTVFLICTIEILQQ